MPLQRLHHLSNGICVVLFMSHECSNHCAPLHSFRFVSFFSTSQNDIALDVSEWAATNCSETAKTNLENKRKPTTALFKWSFCVTCFLFSCCCAQSVPFCLLCVSKWVAKCIFGCVSLLNWPYFKLNYSGRKRSGNPPTQKREFSSNKKSNKRKYSLLLNYHTRKKWYSFCTAKRRCQSSVCTTIMFGVFFALSFFLSFYCSCSLLRFNG